MFQCLVCGKESATIVCETCNENTQLEGLCHEMLNYQIGTGENALWEEIAGTLDRPYEFKNKVLEVANYLPFPRKEYIKVLYLSDNGKYVGKSNRPAFYEAVSQMLGESVLPEEEENRVRAIVLTVYVSDYRYEEAEAIAKELDELTVRSKWCYPPMIDFYIKTRRYDKAETLLQEFSSLYGEEEGARSSIETLTEELAKRRKAAQEGKGYMPQPPEAKIAYVEFMKTLGEDIKVKKKEPKPISEAEYPEFEEIMDAGFNTFVAYDFETTGRDSKRDAIIEMGAVKVVNGEIKDGPEYVFQKLVKPYKKTIPQDATNLNGITNEDVKSAEEMWEVIPEFLEFVGDNILVGYNNVAFDSRFLRRACRYSNQMINNKQFDVLKYVKRNKNKLSTDNDKLETVSQALGIENLNAHRALADAITTAMVFLKVKEMN